MFTLSIGVNPIERTAGFFEDFILQYMNDCVEYICSAHHVESASLFGICEGGVSQRVLRVCTPKKLDPRPSGHPH